MVVVTDIGGVVATVGGGGQAEGVLSLTDGGWCWAGGGCAEPGAQP